MKIQAITPLTKAPRDVVNLVLEGDLEIRWDHDFVYPLIKGDELVVWADIDGVPVGCQVISKDGDVWKIVVGYIRETFRGKGIMPKIRRLVRELAKNDPDCKYIEFLVKTDNKEMLKSLDRDGLKPANFHYRWKAK